MPRERRAYGPHDDTTAPRTVTVLGPEKWPREQQVPASEAVLRQRAQLNAWAHQRHHLRLLPTLDT